MVDLHCHILPGMDDGAENFEQSLAMAESAIADGITHVVATPHANSTYTFDFSRVLCLREELRAKLGGRLELASGCDFHLNPENLAALKTNPRIYCINQHDYLLVELSNFSIPFTMDQTLHELHLAGLRPIITHPERNSILRTQPERLAQWVRLGCYVQVTGAAVTGGFGKGPRQDALAWIGQGLVHFVASDAHNTTSRPLRLQPAYEVVRERYGEETAQALFLHNPLAAFGGRTLPYVPGASLGPPRRRKKRFLFF
jgi:protein-tyrosine phosphatase